MRWILRQGDILDVPADVLICSANVYLTLSGGVGGAFLLRYGSQMQSALNRYLHELGVRHVECGSVIEMPPCGSPYQAVFHAVAVDGLYKSTAEVITNVVTDGLQRAANLNVRTVALSGLAMGYGRLPVAEFAAGLGRVMEHSFPPIESVVVCLRTPEDVQAMRAQLPSLAMAEIDSARD